MEITLQPEVKLQPRYWALGVMLLPVVIAWFIPWYLRLIACIVPAVLCGTYRISTLDGDKFRSKLYVGFFLMKSEKCNLPGVVYVETKYNSWGMGTAMFAFFLPLQFVIGLILDILIPALGGAYEIWLVTAKGREIVAWQGFSQKHFDENLALLVARSGGEIRGRVH